MGPAIKGGTIFVFCIGRILTYRIGSSVEPIRNPSQ